MPVRLRAHWLVPVSVALACAVGAVVLHGQGKPSVDASMTQLVAEIRALREAVERSAFITARTQATLGRVQLQENRLATLGRQLQEARQHLRERQAHQAQLATDLAMMTKTLEGLGPGTDEYRHIEQALQTFRLRTKALQAEVGGLQAEETELSQALSAEQGRWGDYNERLEALERELVAAARRPQQP